MANRRRIISSHYVVVKAETIVDLPSLEGLYDGSQILLMLFR